MVMISIGHQNKIKHKTFLKLSITKSIAYGMEGLLAAC